MEPLIVSQEDITSLPSKKTHPSKSNPVFTNIGVLNYNEEEESSCITQITLLEISNFKCLVVLPLFSILSLFFLPLKLYWDVSLRITWMYNRIQTLDNTTHLFIRGKDGNKEIVKLRNLSDEVNRIGIKLQNPFFVSIAQTLIRKFLAV